MKTLGGYICVRNGFELDYCWQEALISLLPVCSQIVLCDSDSTDGTRKAMELQVGIYRNVDVKVVNWPWRDPKGEGPRAWIEWLNFARGHLDTEYQITLDADEVLSDTPLCRAAIYEAMQDGRPRTFERLNFWRDPRSLIPDGQCCGRWVTRFGPASYQMCSDEPHGIGTFPLTDEAVQEPRVRIFHMGFLRRPEAFYRKSKVVQQMWNNSYDPRLQAAEDAGKPVWDSECDFTNQLEPYKGSFPAILHLWLKERGFGLFV